MTGFAWRACQPGDLFAIVLHGPAGLLPFSVCRVGSVFEAWERHPSARGGYWGGLCLGRFSEADAARAWCERLAGSP